MQNKNIKDKPIFKTLQHLTPFTHLGYIPSQFPIASKNKQTNSI
jgi:hypothetical protein